MQKDPVQHFILQQVKPLLKISTEGPDCLGLRIDESGIDSLELMELVMTIEAHYAVKIDDAVLMETALTIGELINRVEQLASSPE